MNRHPRGKKDTITLNSLIKKKKKLQPPSGLENRHHHHHQPYDGGMWVKKYKV